MSAVLNSIAPATGVPGAQITLAGSGIAAGAIVWFATDLIQVADPNSNVVDAGNIQAAVPDQFGGAAAQVQVYILNPGQAPSTLLPFSVLAVPTEPTDIYPLCNLTDLKAFLGILQDDESKDDDLKIKIRVASSQIVKYCGRDFRPTAIDHELHDGNSTDRLDLIHTPVQSVVALSIDGQSVDVSEIAVYQDYIRFISQSYDWNPRLRAYGRVFGEGVQNVSVSYTAGYAVIPGDLGHACFLQVAHLMNTGNKQGIASETNQVANSMTTYVQDELCTAARQRANRYKRTVVRAI
jgi:Phage gp6-like head-tail connector protein